MGHMLAFVILEANSSNKAREKLKSNLNEIKKLGRLSFFDWYLIVNDWSRVAISSLEYMVGWFSAIIKEDIILEGEKTKIIDIFEDMKFEYEDGAVKLNQDCYDKIIIEWVVRFNLKDYYFRNYINKRLEHEKYLQGELGGPDKKTLKLWENLIGKIPNFRIKIDDIGLIYLINMTDRDFDQLLNNNNLWVFLVDYNINIGILNL